VDQFKKAAAVALQLLTAAGAIVTIASYFGIHP